MSPSLESRPWWNYIHEDLQELLKQSMLLLEIFGEDDGKEDKKTEFHDYAFIAFPAAKAYEGFLKTLFRDLNFITEEEFSGKRFRIGRALNPELEKFLRERESVYDRIVNYCGGKHLADVLWDSWKSGRNLLFHWFPNERNAIGYEEAKATISRILDAMDLAFKSCDL